MSYRIREVDGDEHTDILAELHEHCFGTTAEQADYSNGHWWLVYFKKEPIAFAGLTPSQLAPDCGYLKRAGVLPAHRGQGLQGRLIRVREARAKKNGWGRIVTDCTDNPASGNSLAKAGYKMFSPKHGWAFPHSIYWQKTIQ